MAQDEGQAEDGDRGQGHPDATRRRPVSDATEHAAQRDRPRDRDGQMLSTDNVEVGSRSRASRGHDHAREGLVRRLALYRTPNPFRGARSITPPAATASPNSLRQESDRHLQRVITRLGDIVFRAAAGRRPHLCFARYMR